MSQIQFINAGVAKSPDAAIKPESKLGRITVVQCWCGISTDYQQPYPWRQIVVSVDLDRWRLDPIPDAFDQITIDQIDEYVGLLLSGMECSEFSNHLQVGEEFLTVKINKCPPAIPFGTGVAHTY